MRRHLRFLLGTATIGVCKGIAGGARHCTIAGGQSIAPPALGVALLARLVLAPIATSVYLARRATQD
jgi:hypothetical protein